VTGAGGMTGSEITRQAANVGWDCISFSKSELDIANRDAVFDAIGSARPDIVVNAAAFTAVDDAEREEQRATRINGVGAGFVAQAASAAGAGVIHISTDYVFDGRSSTPYLPSDPVSPVNAYGRSKLAGEKAVRDANPRHVIVRTSWVYSHEGRNFVRTMLRLGETRNEISVVCDQQGSPTSAADLAAALLKIADTMRKGGAASGTHHFSNAGVTNWYEFAKTIFEMRGEGPVVEPIATADYPTPAARPAWSVLDCTSFEKEFSMQRRPWQTALRDVMDKLQ
jgi:dTDP-4-dehydrorhamnose reductase